MYSIQGATNHELDIPMIDPKHVLAAMFATTVAGTVAHAQTVPATPSDLRLDVGMLTKRLSSQGFSNFSEVELKSDKLYEVTAHDTEGLRWEMYVDARTGEILKKERD